MWQPVASCPMSPILELFSWGSLAALNPLADPNKVGFWMVHYLVCLMHESCGEKKLLLLFDTQVCSQRLVGVTRKDQRS